MKGYLARLAERALATAPTLHARASLPFAPPPAIPDAYTPSPVSPDDRPLAARRRKPVDDAGEPFARPRPGLLDASSEAPAQGLEPLAREAVQSQASPDGASPRPTPGREPAPAPAATDDTARAHIEPHDRATPARPAPVASPAHAPLRSPGPSPAVARAVALAATAGRPAPQDAPAVPDVHIHIGHIEVRGPSASPPAPRKPLPRPGKPPLSLDEYLRRRDGGAR